jgi:hypothetical protein
MSESNNKVYPNNEQLDLKPHDEPKDNEGKLPVESMHNSNFQHIGFIDQQDNEGKDKMIRHHVEKFLY